MLQSQNLKRRLLIFKFLKSLFATHLSFPAPVKKQEPRKPLPRTSQNRGSLKFQGKIHLIVSNPELAKIDFSNIKAFGFDTETKPAFKKGEDFKTALLQLATDTDAYLIRLHYLNRFNPLKEVFENSKVLKVGAAIAHDLRQLQRIFPFEPKGFVDIQKVGKEKGLKNLGLKKMTEEVFGSTLYKGPKMTNWERNSLTDEQLLYAATDAWIGLKLYNELTTEKSQVIKNN